MARAEAVWNAVVPDRWRCAPYGWRSPADMKSIFQADTAADTGTNGRYWCRSERSKEGKQDDGTGLPGRNAASDSDSDSD